MGSEVDRTTSGKDIVIFSIRRDSKCSECGVELMEGKLLEDGKRPATVPGMRGPGPSGR